MKLKFKIWIDIVFFCPWPHSLPLKKRYLKKKQFSFEKKKDDGADSAEIYLNHSVADLQPQKNTGMVIQAFDDGNGSALDFSSSDDDADLVEFSVFFFIYIREGPSSPAWLFPLFLMENQFLKKWKGTDPFFLISLFFFSSSIIRWKLKCFFINGKILIFFY